MSMHTTEQKSVRYLLTGGLAALALAGAAPAADATDPTQPPTVVVSYDDLNIDSPQGARILYARIRTAATRVCGSFEGRGPEAFSHFRKCYQQAMDAAVAQVDRPAVTALYAQAIRLSPRAQ
jgi:UrcA family protein